MTFHLALELKWTLLFLAVLFLVVPFWTATWKRYDGWLGPLEWMWKWAWMWGCAVVLGLWTATEFFR